MSPAAEPAIGEYRDEIHAEDPKGIEIGEHGYKYRMLDGVVMPPYIPPARYALSRTLATRPGDICYTSFPKSGSTWLAYLILLIVHRGEPPEDATLRSCLHWVASSWTYPRSREDLEAWPSPRILKSHMPYGMAVGGVPADNPCKYVYIARNPKDVAVSYFHFESEKSWSGNYRGPWEHWLQMFLEGRVQRGDWFDHVLSWWRHRDAPNLHFLRYEDLRRRFEPTLLGLADFLGYVLDEPTLARIRERSTFQAMTADPFSNMHEIKEFNQFFRKGTVGSWKDRFTVAQSEAFDAVYARRMEGSGLAFEFE